MQSMTNEMQSRASMVSSIFAFGMKMKNILAEAKIKFEYVLLPDDISNIPTVYLEEGLKWIKAIHDNEYQACLKTKALIPEDQWELYKFMDMEGSREMIDLKKSFRDLRKRIISKERPIVFRKKRFNAKSQRSGKQRTPEEAGQADIQGTSQG